MLWYTMAVVEKRSVKRLTVELTSDGKAKVQDCWKGQEPELNTWMLKSTARQQRGSS